MLMQWIDVGVVLNYRQEALALVAEVLERAESGELVPFMMEADAQTYLPDDVLAKVDRAAMAYSLETRVPFLDRDVVALSARIPLSFKRKR